MKFKLYTLKECMTIGGEDYEKFKSYGFTFRKGYTCGTVLLEEKEVEINDIQDLMSIINYFGEEIIVGKDTITIYDSYNE